jgi:hypothetical protein
VNPSGSATAYNFSLGPTTAYGITSATQSLKSGTSGVDVSIAVTGLTPGTPYHYRVNAQNASGAASGSDRTFTTTGPPPASVFTGPATAVGTTTATVTGSINPMGASTSWTVQYGLTSAFGLSTFSEPALAAVDQPLPVSAGLVGLAPSTLFFYRLVAFHGDSVTDGGAGTFYTEPLVRPTPNLTTRTTPSTAKKSPYRFTVAGTLHGDGLFPAALRCTGNVGIRVYKGRRQLAFVVAPVGATCSFSALAAFRHDHATGATALRVVIDFRGNGYLGPVVRTDHVTAG